MFLKDAQIETPHCGHKQPRDSNFTGIQKIELIAKLKVLLYQYNIVFTALNGLLKNLLFLT